MATYFIHAEVVHPSCGDVVGKQSMLIEANDSFRATELFRDRMISKLSKKHAACDLVIDKIERVE